MQDDFEEFADEIEHGLNDVFKSFGLPSAVIVEPKKIKSPTVSTSICHEVMGPDAIILVF